MDLLDQASGASADQRNQHAEAKTHNGNSFFDGFCDLVDEPLRVDLEHLQASCILAFDRLRCNVSATRREISTYRPKSW